MPDEQRPLDKLSRHELALLWNDVTHERPDLFAPQEKRLPPYVALTKMHRDYNEGKFAEDGGPGAMGHPSMTDGR